MDRLMQLWRVTYQTDACMDGQGLDWCRYGQLRERLMQVMTVTGQTDEGMDSYCID